MSSYQSNGIRIDAVANNVDSAIKMIDQFAANRDYLKQNLQTTLQALAIVCREVATITPAAQRNITIIRFHLENETDEQDSYRIEQKDAIIATIQKIMQVRDKGQFPPSFQKILKAIVGSPEQAVAALQLNKKICLDEETGTLLFHPEIENELDYELFEALLANMSAPSREKIRLFSIKNYSRLGPRAPELLVRLCPNLSLSTFCNLSPSFCDHILNDIPVNKGLLMALSPYFRALWKNGMRESSKQYTLLPDFEPSAMKLILGEDVEATDVTILMAMAVSLDKYCFLDYREIEQRYERCATQFFSVHKEALHHLDAIRELIHFFTDFFADGKLLKLQLSISKLACPLFELEGFDLYHPSHQEIICFVAESFEVGFREHAIEVLRAYLSQEVDKNEKSRFEQEIIHIEQKRWDRTPFLEQYRTLARCDGVRFTLLQKYEAYERKHPLICESFARIQSFLVAQIKDKTIPELFDVVKKLDPVLCAINDTVVNTCVADVVKASLLTPGEALDFSFLRYFKERIIQIGYFSSMVDTKPENRDAFCRLLERYSEIFREPAVSIKKWYGCALTDQEKEDMISNIVIITKGLL